MMSCFCEVGEAASRVKLVERPHRPARALVRRVSVLVCKERDDESKRFIDNLNRMSLVLGTVRRPPEGVWIHQNRAEPLKALQTDGSMFEIRSWTYRKPA